MTTGELDTYTDFIAKTNSTMFTTAEKLIYYNIAYGMLYARVLAEQDNHYEEEDTKTTVAGQNEYQEKARIHHINWLKVNYGDGFIPAIYKSEADLIHEYGTTYENELTNWSYADPIYTYKGDHFFIYPAPTASQAGADRLWVSIELYPADLTAGETPLLPENFHFLLGEFAAYKYAENNGETESAVMRKRNFMEGMAEMLETMYPRARQAEMEVHVDEDDGSNY